jgi:hypothetical protein
MEVLNFCRTETKSTTLTYTVKHEGLTFEILIEEVSSSPIVSVLLLDYDNNISARGEFQSLDQAVDNMDKFFNLAVTAYMKKYAKYGDMPYIGFNGTGEIHMYFKNPRECEWYEEVILE